ncbi:MAG: chemotaxis protein CheW [Planctomycetes bacterium]|nr:chemotaxis protein CheW [Planctomycetota bacterium]
MTSRKLCTFHLDNIYLGVDVNRVQEVAKTDHVTGVPLADPRIAGLINLRGQIVTAVNLRECLKRPADPTARKPLSLVVRYDGTIVSILVDRMGDVLTVDDRLFLPAPDAVDHDVAKFITGAYRLPQALLLVLDPDGIVAHVTAAHMGRSSR